MYMVDYRKLRPSNINTPEFKHLFLLLYWPVYGATFWLLERGLSLNYHPIKAAFDAKIPFCEFFVFPYYFWFVFLVEYTFTPCFLIFPHLKNLCILLL